MGRQPPPEYVARADAAKELKVSVNTLTRLVRRGLLVPHYFEGHKQQFFLKSDLHLAQLAGGARSVDIRQVNATALMALSAAHRAETRLAEVFSAMGLDVVPLHRDAPSVLALYEEVKKIPSVSEVRDPEWLKYWGGVFFSMDEVYLELVQQLTGDDEPWKVFHDFCSNVTRIVIQENEVALYMAWNRFQAGRNHLRHVSYMHCRRRRGRRIADTVFDGAAPAVNELYSLLHH